MPYPRNHAQNRAMVCLLCFNYNKKTKKITDGLQLERVKKYFFEGFDTSHPKYPNGICNRCRKILLDIEREKSSLDSLPKPVDFSALKFPVMTRSSGVSNLDLMIHCKCDICKISSNEVGETGNKVGSLMKGNFKRGRPKHLGPERLALPTPIKVCQRCYQVTGKGIAHPQPCNLTDRRENIKGIVDEDPRGSEILVSSVIKQKINESNDKNAITLATCGPSMTVPKPDPPPSRACKALFQDKPVTASELSKMMLVNDLSLNQVKNTMLFIGHGMVETLLNLMPCKA